MNTRFQRFTIAARAPGEGLGLHPGTGLALLAFASGVFAYLAHAVMSGHGIVALDVWLAQWFHAHAAEPLISLMLGVALLNSTAAVLATVALLAFYLWRGGARYWLLALLVCVPGGMLLNVLVKHVFKRSRPVFDEPLVSLLTYSFPSGHTAAATLLYGWLACYLFCTQRRRTRSLPVLPACVLMVLLVAISRMYLGAHYLSDVLAAMAEGVAWLALSLTVISAWQRRRQQAPG